MVDGFFDICCFAILLVVCVLFQFTHQRFKKNQRYQVGGFPSLSWSQLLYILLLIPLIFGMPFVMLMVAQALCGGDEFCEVLTFLLLGVPTIILLLIGWLLVPLFILYWWPDMKKRKSQRKIMVPVREGYFSQWLEKLSVAKTKKELWEMLDEAWDPKESPMVHIGALSTFYRTYRNRPLKETIHRAAEDYFTFHNLPLISKTVGIEIDPGQVTGKEE